MEKGTLKMADHFNSEKIKKLEEKMEASAKYSSLKQYCAKEMSKHELEKTKVIPEYIWE